MINIANNDFNKDMDDYLTDRRDRKSNKEPIFSGALKIFNVLKRKRMPSDEEVEKRELKRHNEKELETMEEEIEEIHETEEVMEVEREGIVRRFLKRLRLTGRDEYLEEDEIDASIESKALDSEEKCKETIKILHKWLEQLPPDKLDAFKRSEDFVKYKQTLKDLGLIKQQ